VRLKLDENLTGSIALTLADYGHEVDSVRAEGLAGATDVQVARAAASAGQMLVTLDRDFADIREYPPGTHPGIIVVRVDPPRPSWVKAALTGLLAHHDLRELRGCLVIAQLGTVRIRRPPPERDPTDRPV
jgi:predicted nuclease of predicted toxin-antitoxin system